MQIICLWWWCRKSKKLTVGDAFIGYHLDLAAAIVIHVCNIHANKVNSGEIRREVMNTLSVSLNDANNLI